jgi:hypothetical protein
MCEFVDEQSAAGFRIRPELAVTKDDVSPDRISARIDVTGRLRSGGVRVNPHVAEVIPETRLQFPTQSGIERRATAGQHTIDADWRVVSFARQDGDARDADRSVIRSPVTPCQDFFRHAVGLEFERIVTLADRELSLNSFRLAVVASGRRKCLRRTAGAFALQETSGVRRTG